MKREYRDYIKDILDAIDKIELFSKNIEKLDDFLKDEKTQLAIVKLLENIGEAIKKIPAEIKDKYAEITWAEAAGMRDILVHEYFAVNTEVVWKTIKNDIPSLKPVIKKIWEDNSFD